MKKKLYHYQKVHILRQHSPTDIVEGFVVDHEGTVRMLKSGVGGEDGVVRLNHGR